MNDHWNNSLDVELPPAHRGGVYGDALHRLLSSRTAVISLGIITLFLAAAFFAPRLTPYDPTEMTWGKGNLPPAWVQWGRVHGSPEHWLGTDRLGRDLLARLLYGARTAVFIAFLAAPLAALFGTLIGVLSGFYGGWLDTVLMSFTDVFGAFPSVMFSVLLVFILRDTVFGNWQGGMMTLVLAFALIAWVAPARLLRAGVLKARQELYVEAARSVGVPPLRIVFKHVLPNVSSLAVIWMTSAIPRVIILEALLGYIGIRLTSGVQGGEFYITSWGGLFFDGRPAIRSNPTILIAPSICVILIAVAFTFLGDRLRDTLDPKFKDVA